MATSYSIGIHPDKEESARLEYVAEHDHIREGYFRLRIGDAVIYLSRKQVDEVGTLCVERWRAEENPQ